MSSQPSPPSPLATAEPWDLVANDYSAELLPMFEHFSKLALQLVRVPAGGYVLDVATGPGTLALLAAAQECNVSALDFSEQMLHNLKQRAAAAKLTALEVRQGDGQALPFADGRYDAAFSMFGLMFFPDRNQGFKELLRVLKPGGRAVVSSWAPLSGAFASVMEAVRAMLPGLPFGQGKGPLSDRDEFAAELRAAGFSSVEVHTELHTLQAPSLKEFWESCQRTTAPIVLLRRKLGEEHWQQLAAGVEQRLRNEFGEGPIAITATAHLGIGMK
ncbi:MAG TPA: methyltransferase domain-containing protein [Polyangiaceae bacterium]|nr:methyltransferase domain-containing protein [Polyangiaceae bacterium]